MRQRFTLLTLFLFTITFLLAACSTKKPPQKPRQLQNISVEENGQAVVQVLHTFQVATIEDDGNIKVGEETGIGTGFVVNVSGLVLTNHHIVENTEPKKNTMHVHGSDKIEVCLVQDGLRTCKEAMIIDTDVRNDMALLFVVQAFERAVTFRDDNSLRLGEAVYLWGNIHDWAPPSPTFGTFINWIKAPYATQENFNPITLPVLLLDITFIMGSSGGPSFDKAGGCIGQNKFFTTFGDRPITLTTPSSTIMKFLTKNKVQYKTQ